MGMTIDKIIKRLLWFEDYNEEDYCGGDRIQDEHGDWFYKVTEEDFEAFRQAADTMRKYQELEQEPTTKNDLVLLHTEGLDEEIRCTMCTNYMKSDRGCDGSCVVNNAMYKNVMDAIEKRIQPTTKNNLGVDCISRQAVLDLINADWKYENLEIEINNLPSVTPQEPKTGHWIDINGIYAKCSNCNEEIYITGDFNYCPNCGADMREVEE